MAQKNNNIPKLRFKGFEGEWGKEKLNEVSSRITKGTTPTTLGFEYRNSGINFIKIESISDDGKFLKNKFAYISDDCYKSLNRSQLKKNDILFSIAGALGRVAVVKEDILPANTNQALAIITPKDNILVEYFTEVLRSSFIQNKIDSLKVGLAQSNLSLEQISNFIIPIPLLNEQQKIAEFLIKVDEWIENLKQQKENLEKYKKGMMQKIFAQKIKFKDENGKKFEEWKEAKAGEIFKNHTNKNHNGDLPLLAVTQENGVVYRDDLKLVIHSSELGIKNYKIIEPGDFIISLRSFQGGIEYSTVKGISSPAYVVLKNIIPIHKRFYKHLFKTEKFINKLNTLIYGIRDGKQISYDEFKTLKLPLPTVDNQKYIADFLDTIDKIIDSKQEQIAKAEEWKKGLMQELFV